MFTEGFQNVPGTTPIQRLTSYTGTSGQKYTANPAWLTLCNGWIASANQSTTAAAQVSDCTSAGGTSAAGQSTWNQSQQLAQALGIYSGQTAAAARGNYADTAFTAGNPGAGLVEFQTTSNIPFTASNRFISFSADVAAANCNVSAPLLQFQLLNDAGTPTNAGSQVNACTSGKTVAVPALGTAAARNVNVATATSNGAVLFSGASIGIRMLNNNGSGVGNDHTIDNVRILDVTPQLDKSFSPQSVKTGGTSTLTFTITNTSELGAKNGWSFTDTLPAGLTVANPNAATTTCAAGTVTAPAGGGSVGVRGNLNQGQTACTVSLQVTAAAAGTYSNGPSNVTTSGLNAPGTATVEFSAPSIGLVKHAGTPVDANGNGITDSGDTIPYTFTVTNTGDVALTGVGVTDVKLGAVTCPSTALAVGANETCTAASSYTIAAADERAGSVENTATASGTPPTGTAVTSAPSTTSTPVTAPAPALSLVKTADPAGPGSYEPGQRITYSFAVTNTGNVPMHTVSITEGDFTGTGTLSDPTCPTTSIAVGGAVTCTATYELTQADVDAGTLTNNATAQGTPTGSDTPTQSDSSTATIPNTAAPALTVTKTADPGTVSKAGQTVTYSFVVTNTGNVTLHDVGVTDQDFSGTGELSTITCPEASLATGRQETCSATYTVTQADIDAGTLTNTATANGTPPRADAPTISDPSTATVAVDQRPAITVVKTADRQRLTAANQTVTYSFVVTNTGNVTLHDVAVTDRNFSGTGELSTIVCPSTSLPVGDDQTCTATYTTTQADIDAGGDLTNTATAAGTASAASSSTRSDPSTVAIPIDQRPGLSLQKTAAPADQASYTVGATVTYSFAMTNTGNTTLTDVHPTERDFSGSGTLTDPACPAAAASIEPGASVTCTATYVVTQADVDAGTLTNTATATGTTPDGDPVPADPSTVTVPADQTPALTVTKTADPGTVSKAGQTVTYSFVVTNTGNVTLHDVGVTDQDFSGTDELSTITCPDGSLAPATAVTCTATYTTTQADIDAGTITNTATATGTPPGTDKPITSTPSTATVTVDQTPAISVQKTADATEITAAGEKISYSFTITNTGNVTLSKPTITDRTFSGTGDLSAIDCPETALASGQDATCTATYTTAQADIDAGGNLTNTATAQGTPPGSDTPITSEPSTVRIPVHQHPSMGIVKHAGTPVDGNGNGITDTGDTIAYTFTVTNTGNTTMTDVGVTDTKAGPVTCPTRMLDVGAEQTCTADAPYAVTAADVRAGTVENTATSHGTPPHADTATSSEPSTTHTPTTTPAPGLSLVKTATLTGRGGIQVGTTITYSFAVTNTGNVPLEDVAIDDGDFTGTGELSAITCPVDSLPVGAAATCTATYTVTQSDVDAGKITNTATAAGTPPGGTPVTSNASTATVPGTTHPALALLKTADLTKVHTVGQKVTYSFTITNTGEVTQRDVRPAEGTFTGSGTLPAPTCPAAAQSLAPGQSVTCTAVYSTTHADLTDRTLSNTATAVGTTPNGDPVGSNPSTADVRTVTPTSPTHPAATPVPSAPPAASPAPPGLAFTGFNEAWLLPLSAGLIVLGAALLTAPSVLRRRRNDLFEHEHEPGAIGR
ncbi:beta strand repeat-containing protein [Curtobacterium flaccumfaciens]|uniref:beta strand repeat-containing protein n=1 Tax=Curtobacterium flaccumfaciens TaxID=2035 RepID=UPI001BDE7072|nr:DUF11 domain-containing protein [Curtobacterium flaccumfaciens]MBT1633280.1 DUF11 domain-containing protein [Curtobacterium flaccumfaciens pv. oortii]MCX2846927.1 DUF11 domain-containing protein [Curtobacterium flaccumfaciens pv. oortii]